MDWATIIMFLFMCTLQRIGDELDKAPTCPTYCGIDHKHRMKSYKVNGTECYIYEPEEVPEFIQVKDWKTADTGDWVNTDDGHVVQILKKWDIFVQTCTGTYKLSGTLDTVRKQDIYSISGKSSYQNVLDRKNPTQKEIFFALRAAKGQTPAEAYLEVFDTKNPKTAKKKAAILIKTERIQKILKQDMKDVFEKIGANTESMVEVVWDIAQNGKNDSDRLKASGMMWDAADLVEKNRVTEVAGKFFGFTPEKLAEVIRPKEIDANSENADMDT